MYIGNFILFSQDVNLAASNNYYSNIENVDNNLLYYIYIAF